MGVVNTNSVDSDEVMYFIVDYVVHSEIIGTIIFLDSHTNISKHFMSRFHSQVPDWETLLG